MVKNMEYEVVFYRDAHGRSPVDGFLDDLQRENTVLYELTRNGIRKLRDRTNHGQPLTKEVGDGLMELRVGRKDISRVLWFFTVGARIVLVHGFVKKSNKLPARDREIALRRKADYLSRVDRSTSEERQ